MRTRALLGVLLLTALPVGAGDRLSIRVSPAMSFEPANLTVQVFVEPDAENRAIQVVAESTDFFRSSLAPLDGDKAPRRSVFQYHDLPAGLYEVSGVLMDSRGQARVMVSRNVTVIASGSAQ